METADVLPSSRIASGRFGVTSFYLVNSDEIQIKKIVQGLPSLAKVVRLLGAQSAPSNCKDVWNDTQSLLRYHPLSPRTTRCHHSTEDLAELIHASPVERQPPRAH